SGLVGSWERGLPPSRRASVSASLRRDRAQAGGEGGIAPLRRYGGQAASAGMSRRGWNSARAVEGARVRRRQRRAPIPTNCGCTVVRAPPVIVSYFPVCL